MTTMQRCTAKYKDSFGDYHKDCSKFYKKTIKAIMKRFKKHGIIQIRK